MKGMRFAIKHAIAASVVVAAILTFSASSYFALLLWAILESEPLGGPLVLPFMVLVAAVAGIASVGVALLPVTAVTECICLGREIRLPWQIPLSTAILGIWLMMLAVIAAAVCGVPVHSAKFPAGVFFSFCWFLSASTGGRCKPLTGSWVLQRDGSVEDLQRQSHGSAASLADRSPRVTGGA